MKNRKEIPKEVLCIFNIKNKLALFRKFSLGRKSDGKLIWEGLCTKYTQWVSCSSACDCIYDLKLIYEKRWNIQDKPKVEKKFIKVLKQRYCQDRNIAYKGRRFFERVPYTDLISSYIFKEKETDRIFSIKGNTFNKEIVRYRNKDIPITHIITPQLHKCGGLLGLFKRGVEITVHQGIP